MKIPQAHPSTPGRNAEDRRPRPVLPITWGVLSQVAETVGSLPAETGGAFGGSTSDRKVSAFHFDESSRTSAVTYSPDYRRLNRLFKTEWNPRGIRLFGFVHSHPGEMCRPSRGDEIYAERILSAIPDMKVLWLPIVNTLPDTGEFLLTPWAAILRDGEPRVIRGAVQILDVPGRTRARLAGFDAAPVLSAPTFLGEIRLRRSSRRRFGRRERARRPHAPAESGVGARDPRISTGETFQRVQAAYDLPLMHRSRIIAVGAGDAAEWLEQLARAGLGQFVLIDPDTVSETNLATQQTYRRDIGRPKVDCIAERIRDINPAAEVLAFQRRLDDFEDGEISALARDRFDRGDCARTVIAGLTDDFFAQARVNRLALQFGLPSLNAQVYLEGRGAEVTFTFPGVTPACNRCILSSRYRHFVERAQANDVTSHGTPIFATTRLNAIKGFVALALFHHGSAHPRWGNALSRIGKRNLVLVRMDPDFADTVGMRTFDRALKNADQERLFFDESLWLPQEPESPATGRARCPDCGGTGDLRDAIGTIPRTALERPPASTTEPGQP